MQQVAGRLAPTPSGFVHVGNAVNFLLTNQLVRERDALLWLRIDDLDPQRTSDDSIAEIFWALEWLGITVDRGPRNPDEFTESFQHPPKREYYLAQLSNTINTGLPVYYCTCSRSQLTKGGWLHRNDWREHPCRIRTKPPDQLHTVRVAFDNPMTLAMNSTDHNVNLADPVVWRRDGLPGYHLTSLVDDRDACVNLIVRGYDLLESSLTQLALAPYLQADSFVSAQFVHHGLIVDAADHKLSKSDHAESLRSFASRGGTVAELTALAAELSHLDPAQTLHP